jgi:hypothetical protein
MSCYLTQVSGRPLTVFVFRFVTLGNVHEQGATDHLGQPARRCARKGTLCMARANI